MKIAFRCEAGASVGGGHVMRCLTLAGELARRGGACLFLVSPETAMSVPALGASGFASVSVGSDPAAALAAIRGHWPGGADWLVVDCYRIGASQERALRAGAARVMVIDDLADRAHDCDLLLDQNPGRSAATYRALVPPGAPILAGPLYALLRPEFAAVRPAALARRALGRPARRVMVSLGLTDVGAITARVVNALLAVRLPVTFDAVLSAQAPSWPALDARAAREPSLALHADLGAGAMCRLMADADLAIGAAGSTSWERCCLGLPSIVLALAENQRHVAEALARAGAAAFVPLGGDLEQVLPAAAAELLGTAAAMKRMSGIALGLVDGEGAGRVAAAMTGVWAVVSPGHLPMEAMS